jgi:septal ring factor EnvC (AmiA/AmiB activator)
MAARLSRLWDFWAQRQVREKMWRVASTLMASPKRRPAAVTGASGNAHTSGLDVRVNFTDAQILAGAGKVDLTVSRGIGSQLNQLLNKLTDPFSGRLTTIDHELQINVDDLQKSIDQQKTLISDKQQQLAEQFATLESTISSLKQIGSQLSTQLTSFTTSSTSKN